MTDDARQQAAGVAVVTGGSRGVGRGIAIALGSHGYTVYVTGRTQTTGRVAVGRHDRRHRRRDHRGRRKRRGGARRPPQRRRGRGALRASSRGGRPSRHSRQQRGPDPRRAAEPAPVLGEAAGRERRPARGRPPQRPRRQLLRGAAAGRDGPRAGGVHLGPGRGALPVRGGLRRAQGGHGQVRRRHGGRLPAVRRQPRCRSGWAPC